MRARRILTRDSAGTPVWVRIYVQPVGALWAAMIVPDGASPPAPGQLQGAAFLAESAEAAECRAISYLGEMMPHD